MRAPCLALVVAGLALLAPESAAEEQAPFWQRMSISNDREIQDALSQAKELYQSAQKPIQDDEDDELRIRMLREARGMLRFALGLKPDHREVLERLAMVEQAAGRLQPALTLYERVFGATDKDPMSSEACTRYGRLLARAGQRSRAIAVMRRCIRLDSVLGYYGRHIQWTAAVLNLGNLYAAEGRIEEAIALLVRERAARTTGILSFALVVLCDKDHQLNRAYELLHQHKQADERFVHNLARDLDTMEMVPAEDRHYFMALLLEARGSLPEAREEWHHYVRSGDQAHFAERARQHIEAIDALLAEQGR